MFRFGIGIGLLLATRLVAAQPQRSPTTHSPHGPLNVPCQSCHTLSGWKPIRNQPEFDHNSTRFPLRGMHESVACTQCHVKPVFTNVGSKCADCHADIHKRQFGANCEQCHTVKGWQVSIQQINQHQNRFPLIGAHAALDCEACHKGVATGQFQGLATQCYSCHAKDYQTAQPSHTAGSFPTTCEQCHSFNSWLGAKFDHLRQTGFALTGAHATLDCTSCHVGGKFAGTPATCVGCHLGDFQKTNNPNHLQAAFPQTCQTCHNTAAWDPATFDHNTFTRFPLTGAHATVACNQCHANGQFASTPTDCASCHMKDYQGTTNPNHVQAGMPTTCATCHSTTSWANANFDHNTTGFPLTGAHTSVQCAQCHVNGNYNLTDTSCVSCHLKDFQGTTNPNHVQAGFAQTCQSCHNTTTWANATFDHSRTGFPLTGAHLNTQCAQCHVNNNYNLTDTSCVSCHLKDFQTAANPNHVQAGFPQTCQQCHNTVAWSNATFDHNNTGFPLTGAHTSVQCAQCHINNNYNLTDTSCVSCHLKDFQTATNPNHVQAGFPQTCQTCHSTTSWNASFNHSTTGFPLTGAHTALQCAQCHLNNNYNLTDTSCVSCHLRDYQTTTNPNHVSAGFPQSCQTCHTTTDWNASFNHATTGFALTGAHTALQCAQCHINNNYNIADTSCVSCHLKDFQTATNPNHVSAGFPQTCQTCHTTTDWNATFNHATTGFALTGAHTSLQCAQCHVNNNYSLTTGACASCHLKDYQTTTNPNHAAAGFPQTCDSCHTTASWAGATFDHTSTGFPLTGAHTGLQCAQCHVNGNYSLTNTACVACHLTDFNGTTNPNHVTAGYPQQCEVCHNTTAWIPSSFNHNNTAFPLTGAHTTVACANCHVNNNYTTVPTDCYSCHKVDYQGTTNPNHAAAGFPTTCATCHTTTAWTGATFNHTYFPLNHGGANGVCATCHTNASDYSVFQCTNCHAKTQTDNNHRGVRNYVYASPNCYQCHQNGQGG